MTQDSNNRALFTVASGENVTISLESVQCNCLTSAGYDGQALVKHNSAPDTYSFTVAGNSGDQKLFAGACVFLDGTPAFARYTVEVSNDRGDVYHASPVICQIPRVDFQLTFTVA